MAALWSRQLLEDEAAVRGAWRRAAQRPPRLDPHAIVAGPVTAERTGGPGAFWSTTASCLLDWLLIPASEAFLLCGMT
jgi:hypothetical protein